MSGLGGVRHIEFANDTKDAKKRTATSISTKYPDGFFESIDEKRADIDAEAYAQDIADKDLNASRKQTYKGWSLLWLSYQSIGVIYGDIGTSPLYVFSSTFSSQPSYDDLVGALSIIIWTLTLIVSVKYVFICLNADDDGEGGTFALYSLLARYAHIIPQSPNIAGTVKMDRHATNELKRPHQGVRNFLERSRATQVVLKALGVVGVSMVMADGVLTPAQSVLGAIQGIKVASPGINNSTVVGVTCAILVLLFAIQPLGTHRLASGFAPVVIIWLLFNMISGIYNLVQHDHTVLKAFNPYLAGHYLIRNGEDGWRSMGGLLLAFTGVEALFADLGAFSKRAIQFSWLCFAFPCLLLAYIGQAAYISRDASGTAYTNPFFNTVPPGSLYFSLIIAILAAIVGSQALVTASFQLLSHVMKFSYFPHIKVIHTSKKFFGQVYMPFANILLMIGTIVVTATTRLGHAYGVCVIVVTFITTCMLTLVAIIIWRVNILVVIVGFLVFGALDGVYLSAALTKVPHGGWFTIFLAALLSAIFCLWRYGKEKQWAEESLDRLTPAELFFKAGLHASSFDLTLLPPYGGAAVSRVPGMGIFFDKIGAAIPLVFTQFVSKFSAMPELLIFFHMRPLPIPSVPESERFVVTRVTGIPLAYRVTIRHGYTDEVVQPDLGELLVTQLIEFVTRSARPCVDAPRRSADQETSPSTSTGTDAAAAIPIDDGTTSATTHITALHPELHAIETARRAQTVFVMGKEQLRIRHGSPWYRRVVLWCFLWIRENSRAKMANLNLPVERLVEVGFVKEI